MSSLTVVVNESILGSGVGGFADTPMHSDEQVFNCPALYFEAKSHILHPTAVGRACVLRGTLRSEPLESPDSVLLSRCILKVVYDINNDSPHARAANEAKFYEEANPHFLDVPLEQRPIPLFYGLFTGAQNSKWCFSGILLEDCGDPCKFEPTPEDSIEARRACLQRKQQAALALFKIHRVTKMTAFSDEDGEVDLNHVLMCTNSEVQAAGTPPRLVWVSFAYWEPHPNSECMDYSDRHIFTPLNWKPRVEEFRCYELYRFCSEVELYTPYTGIYMGKTISFKNITCPADIVRIHASDIPNQAYCLRCAEELWDSWEGRWRNIAMKLDRIIPMPEL
ncbi:hypothetical protein BXZ70DRAFT_364976 [Cristinia sonorae]|uniref:Uncharacterized protein n=1 Tax=Cristinia sonorae TaxID=1940300 RepID=A0A8K0XNE1_9AGAR|nr:hypothetical protein BXZ70DRAFT_364976 [Cristinia sonorae]